MIKRFLITLTILIFILPTLACGGQIPSTKSAHSMTQQHFKRYAKKYKDSIFGTNRMQRIEVNTVRQQSNRLAEIDAFLTFENGAVARVLLTTKKTPPFGWSIISWEMLEMR